MAAGGGALPLASNARIALWSDSSWSKDMLRPATWRRSDRAWDLQVRVRVQCLPVSTRITPQCLLASYSRSFSDSFLEDAEAVEGRLATSTGSLWLWPLLLARGRSEDLMVSWGVQVLVAATEPEPDEEELEELEELELLFTTPALLSFIFSEPPPLALALPLDEDVPVEQALLLFSGSALVAASTAGGEGEPSSMAIASSAGKSLKEEEPEVAWWLAVAVAVALPVWLVASPEDEEEEVVASPTSTPRPTWPAPPLPL